MKDRIEEHCHKKINTLKIKQCALGAKNEGDAATKTASVCR